MQDKIIIRGAREHNLKNINLEIPKNTLTVFTGLSGSGKSTLAFDTIYAEGQRRYVESLSAYARQFLGLMNKPDVDSIEGLSPAISIDQKGTSSNPRSTVGTVTEIYDYLRLLYARIGTVYCHQCGKKISSQTPDEITDAAIADFSGQKILVLAPLVRGKKGTYEKLFEEAKKDGFARARVDGGIVELEDYKPSLDKQVKHNIEIVVERLTVSKEERSRLFDAVNISLRLADGLVVVAKSVQPSSKDASKEPKEGEKPVQQEILYSQKNSCPDCGISVGELQPRMFSFNSPFGACGVCHGLGRKIEFDVEKVIPDKSKALLEGAVAPWNNSFAHFRYEGLKFVGKKFGFDLTTPLGKFSKEQLQVLLYGTDEKIQYKYKAKTTTSTWEYEGKYEGVLPTLERLYRETDNDAKREALQRFMSESKCPGCEGRRLKAEALAVKINNKSIFQATELSIDEAYEFFTSLRLNSMQAYIARTVLKEIKSRLEFLRNVGLNYLTLGREAGTLSGGEAQRIRLATQIGSNLTGVLYVLDEPSIGLHQRDNAKLLYTLKRLRDLGNTLVVVEHDEDTMREADYLVDIGPGPGVHGGKIVSSGTLEEMLKCRESITAQYLRGDKFIPFSRERRAPNNFLKVIGASENNLQNIDVAFPLGVLACVTGVSGSGKSSLVHDVLFKALQKHFGIENAMPGAYKRLDGLELVDKVIEIDQSPIGRTPRSNPATYIGMFTPIRELFASTQAAKIRGFDAGWFSFNVPKGRCEACEGDGVKKIEMNFLPDVYVLCEECKGKRYSQETLLVQYKGKNISEILEMTVEEALPFFENITSISSKLQTLNDVGLGYIKLGQSATTLSGGEAQRVKIAAELSKRATGKTVYILDEPTTGLHFDDVSKLISVLISLVEKGNSVLVIEHNLDVIKSSDHILDLGPEGGSGGGRIVACGTPEQICKAKDSYTGQYLKKVLYA
ncbi:excinuclease ABC subunit UvrA [Candidatus Parvarchaeota archaeon]|nr:excinuclease ABC subunit UvrA [Candidatus Parvarchaeota archaeon]